MTPFAFLPLSDAARQRKRNLCHNLTFSIGVASLVGGGLGAAIEIESALSGETSNPIIGAYLAGSLLTYGTLLVVGYWRKWHFPFVIAIALFFVALAGFFATVYLEDALSSSPILAYRTKWLFPIAFLLVALLVEVVRRGMVAKVKKVT